MFRLKNVSENENDVANTCKMETGVMDILNNLFNLSHVAPDENVSI